MKDLAALAAFFAENFDDPELIVRAQEAGYTSLRQIRGMNHAEKEQFYRAVSLGLRDRKRLDQALDQQGAGRARQPEAAPAADDKEPSAAPLATLDAALESKDFTAICRALFKAGGSVDEKKRDEVRATLHAIREVSPLLSLLLPCLSVLCSLRSACGVIIGPSLPLGLPVASHPSSPPLHLCPSFCMWCGILSSLAGVAGREVLPPRPPRTSRP